MCSELEPLYHNQPRWFALRLIINPLHEGLTALKNAAEAVLPVASCATLPVQRTLGAILDQARSREGELVRLFELKRQPPPQDHAGPEQLPHLLRLYLTLEAYPDQYAMQG